jgi:hypothetical protein
MEIEQHELRELLPGSAGGRALRRLKGSEYFAKIGSTGGKKTRDRYGVEYLKQLSARGGEATRRKFQEQPQTIHGMYGEVERRIPYKPPNSRSTKPKYVYIELEPPKDDLIVSPRS